MITLSAAENVNAGVDQLMADGFVHRVLAQVEVRFSNSMIEAFWRSLRHQWLYLHSLESFTQLAQLAQLINFYVREHDTQMRHHAFVGQTPDEVYFGQADRVRDRLTTARHQARRARMEANRGESFRVCAPPTQQSMSVINAVANAPPRLQNVPGRSGEGLPGLISSHGLSVETEKVVSAGNMHVYVARK